MVKKRGLGKSLNALLAYTSTGSRDTTTSSDETSPVNTSQETLQQLSVDMIQRGKYQPRRDMDPQALEDLANSIRTQGIIQPLIVRPIDDRYEIIAGERRWQAAQLAGLTEVPVIVRHIPDEAAVAIALIENIQRENLNPMDEALALERLINEFSLTHQQVAEAIGKSRTTVTNLLRLLTLPDTVKQLLAAGKIEMGHARTLITLPASQVIKIAEMVTARGLSVRETEQLVRRLHSNQTPDLPPPVDPAIQQLQDTLKKQINLPVTLKCNAKGRGKLVIRYRNLNELNRLMARFRESETVDA